MAARAQLMLNGYEIRMVNLYIVCLVLVCLLQRELLSSVAHKYRYMVVLMQHLLGFDVGYCHHTLKIATENNCIILTLPCSSAEFESRKIKNS